MHEKLPAHILRPSFSKPQNIEAEKARGPHIKKRASAPPAQPKFSRPDFQHFGAFSVDNATGLCYTIY